MQKWIAAAAALTIGMTACNTSENMLDSAQATEAPTLTLADVVPVMHPESPEQKAAQQAFLEASTKRFKSKKLASAYFIEQAKRAFNEQKSDSAAILFGQAWLMDSTNSDVYQGYGRVYGQQKQYDKALFILYHALEAAPNDPQLLTDIATSHLGRFYDTSNPDDLQQSKKLLEQALTLTPDKADIYYKLAINNYYLKDYSKAWEYLHESLQENKDLEDQSFISALLEKQQDPQGIYTGANVQ
ncbi:tetratricopeptide repeat protein [Pontibacter chitinilyticus]|uniref:tetratricopeptide repeat protein n=1 Tax=Pontibacter chitinilyticus TaxID=2674989 RepID=UPI00321954E4